MSFNKETGMYEGYIYKIVNDVNDKIYIGQTRRTIEERWRYHIYDAKHKNDNMIIHKAMMKYGVEKFHYIMIEKIVEHTISDLVEQLNEKEKYYISTYNTIRPFGYNISIGGNILDFNKIPVDQYDLDCNYINSFDSIIEASLFTNIPRASIEKCTSDAATSNKSAYGYVFVKSGFPPYKVDLKNREVNQYDLKGNLIRTYTSIKDAETATNINSSNINYCCQKQKYKTAGNYIWRYKEDELTSEEKENLLNGTYLTRESIYPEIKQYDIFGTYIASFPNVAIASQITDTFQATIINCCLGKINTANKYVWRFIDDEFSKYNVDYSAKISKTFPYINMYSLDDQFLKTFISPTEACSYIRKKNISAICNCCNHVSKTSYGYKWFWVFDDKQPCKNNYISKDNLYNYSYTIL